MRRPTLLLLAILLTLPLAVPASGESPFTPPRDQWYAFNDEGHFTDSDADLVRIDADCEGLPEADAVACSLEAFQDREFVVIAFVDSGINAYHQDFRAPEFVHHPADYIDGYPVDTPAITLSFDLADDEGYAAARDADTAAWQAIGRNDLRWIPGTRIIGGISVGAGGAGGGFPDLPVLDENGHGTGVASVAAGRRYGANPNALIVMVEGLGGNSVAWAAAQPWIDIVSNSWGPGLPGRADIGLSSPNGHGTRESTRRGQSVLFSAGNGMRNTNSSDVLVSPLPDPCQCKIPGHNVSATAHTSGPSWVLTVGAISPINGQAHWWHGIPVDVASFGSKWRAASVFGVDLDDSRDFGGTSCATPITAGVLSAVIEDARRILGDTVGGQRPGAVVAQAPEGHPLPTEGPLADGVLTREEAERITLTAARPVPFDPETYTWDYAVEPTTDEYYVQQGYGVMDADAKERALAVVRGEMPLPDRADVDAFRAETDRVRDLIWGAP